jgi:CTP synthase (UTP-ammonia lyase)
MERTALAFLPSWCAPTQRIPKLRAIKTHTHAAFQSKQLPETVVNNGLPGIKVKYRAEVKAAQLGIKRLMEAGVQPHIIACRARAG